MLQNQAPSFENPVGLAPGMPHVHCLLGPLWQDQVKAKAAGHPATHAGGDGVAFEFPLDEQRLCSLAVFIVWRA